MSTISVFLSALLIAAIAGAHPHSQSDKVKNYRLTGNVKPTHYTLTLVPNLEMGIFHGETNIKIGVSKEATTSITLHAKGLAFDHSFSEVIGTDDVCTKPCNHTIDKELDFLTLHFDKPGLNAGHYTLNLKYQGKLNNYPEGFYRGSYMNNLGEKKMYAATHFTPTGARSAFPCFDEPALKAKYDIIVWSSSKCSIISNMPPLEGPPMTEEYLSPIHFATTPLMSTNEVAIVVTELESITTDHKRLRFWSQRNSTSRISYAIDTAKQALRLLEDYTNFECAIPTIDNVVIPEYKSSAKQSWGLVTYAEKDVLFDEKAVTISTKQDILLTMSRELTKQWFGNLVTPSWWEDTWLYEGFANYFQYFVADQIEMKWRMMEQFVIKNLQQTALIVDSKEDTHALNANVNTPAEISGLFNGVTSSKSGSLLRMFSHALGAKVLRTGLKEYVRKYAYSSVCSDDLINVLATTKGVPENVDVKSALVSWVKNPGYPIITVHRRYYQKEGGIEKHYNDHTFSQTRYFSTKTNSAATGVWTIPVTFTTEDDCNFEDTTPQSWINTTICPHYYPGVTADKWVLYNKQQTGIYRVNYDEHNWRLLANYLRSPKYHKIHAVNRAQLIDDSFHLVKSGHISDYSIFLDITRYLEQEIDYVPWYATYRAIITMDKYLINTRHYDLFKAYFLSLIKKSEETFGYTEVSGESHTTKLARLNVVRWASRMGSQTCYSSTQNQLIEHIEGTKKITIDLRKEVLCAGIRTADAAVWDKTLAYYQKTSCPIERSDIVTALACSHDYNILTTYLHKTQNSHYELSLKNTVKEVISRSCAGVDAAIDYLKDNYRYILKHGETQHSILDYVNDIGKRITTEEQTDKLEKFSNCLLSEDPEFSRVITKQALVSASRNMEWVERHERHFVKFFKQLNLTVTNSKRSW